MRRLGSFEVGLGAVDFFLTAATGGLVLRDLVLQLRRLEHREQLSSGDAIADVDVNRLDVAGDLGVNVDLLERSELRRQRERLGQIAAHDPGHGDDNRVRCGGRRRRVSRILPR